MSAHIFIYLYIRFVVRTQFTIKIHKQNCLHYVIHLHSVRLNAEMFKNIPVSKFSVQAPSQSKGIMHRHWYRNYEIVARILALIYKVLTYTTWSLFNLHNKTRSGPAPHLLSHWLWPAPYFDVVLSCSTTNHKSPGLLISKYRVLSILYRRYFLPRDAL